MKTIQQNKNLNQKPRKLSEAEAKAIKWLKGLGGSGYVDRYGRVCAGGEVYSQGAYGCWMRLIACGIIVGKDDRIFLNEKANWEGKDE
jgi:hypothetical protein